ncbi:MAG: glycosyltransferase, partial [Rhizobiaceae bacterium]
MSRDPDGRNQLRILYFCNDLAYFRAHRLPTAERMVAAGHEVILLVGGVTPESAAGLPEQLTLVPTPVERHRLSFRDAAAAWSLARLVRSLRPDVIHAITIKPNLIAAMVLPFLATAADMRVVLTFPGLGRVFEPTGMAGRLRRRLVAAVLALGAGRIGAVATFENASDRERMVSQGVFPEKRAVAIMGAGIDRGKFYPPAAGSGDAPLTFLFASRLLRSKGLAEYVEAARILRHRGSTARFLIAGPNDPGYPDNLDVPALLARDPSDAIAYLGAIPPGGMPDLLRRADIVCLPTRLSEGFPRSLIEAAACGCALIGSDQPSIRQIVLPGRTGWLVDGASVASLVDAMG